MVVSDCDAVGDEWRTHKYAPDAAHASADAVLSGTDVDCGSTYDAIGEALGKGLLRPSDVAMAATRALAARIQTGEFDPPALQPLANLTDARDTNTPASQRLALEAAEQSIVLLGNRNATLPLRPAAGSTVALIGPLGDDASFLKGSKQDYEPAHIVTYAEGLQAAAAAGGFSVNVVAGSGVTKPAAGGLDAAKRAAAAADAVVLAVGIDGSVEHEGGDRTAIDLPQAQQDLVSAVLASVRSDTPVVLVLGNGGPVSVGAIWNGTRLGAAVEALEGGQAAGTALASVLLGSVRPSGALPYQMLPPGYVNIVACRTCQCVPGRAARFVTRHRRTTRSGRLAIGSATSRSSLTPPRASATALRSRSRQETSLKQRATAPVARAQPERLQESRSPFRFAMTAMRPLPVPSWRSFHGGGQARTSRLARSWR